MLSRHHFFVVLLLGILVCWTTASAHRFHVSKSRWRILPAEGFVGGSLSILGEDIVLATNLKRAKLPEKEAEKNDEMRRRALIHFGNVIQVKNNGKPCDVRPLSLQKKKKYELSYRWKCGAPLEKLSVNFGFVPKLAPSHRHVARFKIKPRTLERVYTRNKTQFEHVFEVSEPEPDWRANKCDRESLDEQEHSSFSQLVWAGMEHIAGGWDHLLFLLALIAFGGGLKEMVLVVSAFTVAHSVTLLVSFMGWYVPPSSWIEPLIALSIVYVGLENFWIENTRSRWPIAFGFGLVHGFGFAGFLSELSGASAPIWHTLLAFNLGVEIGQVAAVCLAFPLVAYVAGKPWQKEGFVYPLSITVMAAGMYWLVERTFG